MAAFYACPGPHWQLIRTNNPGESPFAGLRLRTDAAKRYKRAGRATAVIWRLLMVAEGRFRRLKGPHLLPGVYVAHSKVKPGEEREQVREEVTA